MYTKPFLFSKFSRHRRPDFKPQLVLNKLVAINHEGWMGGGRTTNTSATIQTKAKGTDATTDRTHKQQQQNHNIQAKSVQCVFTDTTAVGGFPPFFVFFILSCSFVSLSREEKQQVYNPSHAFLSFLSFLSFFRFLSFASIPLFLQFAKSHCNHTSCMSQYC